MDEQSTEEAKELFGERNNRFRDYVYWIITTIVALIIPQISNGKVEMMVMYYGIAAILAILVWYVFNVFHERKKRTDDATRRQVVMIEEVRIGFQKISSKVDKLTDAQQTTMRATLLHNAEKYLERGWITPEERASWCDMHDKYASLGANGLIDTYRQKLNSLPDKEIEAML